MSQDKSKNYDFDSEDPFNENPLEQSAENGPLEEEEFTDFGELDNAQANLEEKSEPKDKKPSGVKEGVMGLLKEYYLYLIGGVILLIVIYYMYGMIFPSQPAQAPKPAQTQQQGFGVSLQPVKVPPRPAVETSAPAQSQPTTPAESQPQTLAFTQNDLKQMIDGFSNIVDQKDQKIESQMATIVQQQSQLTQAEQSLTSTQQTQLTQLNTEIKSLTDAINQSNQSMANISQALVRTQAQLKLLVAEKAQSRDQLSLRAIVPGRAWLVNGSGRTISVAVGDEIQDYGKVESIDAKSATVMMSSGYVFN